jgi:hypothetical protein
MNLYWLRYLLLKKDTGTMLSSKEAKKLKTLKSEAASMPIGSMDAESRAVHAVCVYMVRKNSAYLNKVIEDYLLKKHRPGGVPLSSLPDLLEKVREAGLWNRKLQSWQERLSGKGVLNFNMTR